ncbi:mobile element protein [Vibrio ponticus]|nr:mobile element protein [Vibrio ponticus]
MSIPGFGPLTSQAVAVWLGSGQQFKTGRDASAAMGLVPKQDTTGGNVILLGITKRGNTYIRSLLVHGARAALRRAKFKSDKLSKWMLELQERRGTNRAASHSQTNSCGSLGLSSPKTKSINQHKTPCTTNPLQST